MSSNNEILPVLIGGSALAAFPSISATESAFLKQAAGLFADEYYDHALLDIWNASVANLRRRVEAYSTELFISVVKDEPGRKKFNSDGESLSERWSGVDDLVLIEGSARLGLLNKKAAKALEMINWMRNHASPAHGTDQAVEREDVIALVLLLQKNLFEYPLPDPGHSVAGIFEPIKKKLLDEAGLDLLRAEINGLRKTDVRTAFGFMLDVISDGSTPAIENARELFPSIWEKSSEDLKKTAGLKYHALVVEGGPSSTDAKTRLLETLVVVDGIAYIPEGARATIYKRAAQALAKAKDSSYGWDDENKAARSLAQFGPHVPKIAFDEVYQEILAVWCGNFWGSSNADIILDDFIARLDTQDLRRVVELFVSNDRVRSELFQSKPNSKAKALLERIKGAFTLESHKNEVDVAIASL